MSRTDRAIGITLGFVIGVVAVIIFVFAGGGGIDDASLDRGEQTSIEPGVASGDDPSEGGGSTGHPGEGG